MVQGKKEMELLNELEAAAASHGFDLVDIERTGSGRNALIRVYIDKEGGLSLDDVAAANSWVSEVVERLDPYKGSYTLEVSSPGIDRPLRTFAHFCNAVGEEATIQLKAAPAQNDDTQASNEKGAKKKAGTKKGEGSKSNAKKSAEATSKPRLKYTGTLVGVDLDKHVITLDVDGEVHSLEFAQIKKARIKGQLDFDKKG